MVKVKLIDENLVRVIEKEECMYNYKDILNYLEISDINEIKENLEKDKININDFIKYIDVSGNKEKYISTYGLISLIISIQNNKTIELKKWIIKNTLEKLKEIENPEYAIDMINTINFKKGLDTNYTFKRTQIFDKRYSEPDINYRLVKEDIENSNNYYMNRQINEDE